MNTIIPKEIYLCYKDLDILKKYSKKWKELNPEYNINLYDDQLCENFLLENYNEKFYDLFRFIKDGPIKADFWRACLLYKYGGVYADADIEPLIPIKDFLEENIHFLTCLSIHNCELNPQFIISEPKSEIMEKIINIYFFYYENNLTYSYWNWSITKIIDNIFFNRQIFDKENCNKIANNITNSQEICKDVVIDKEGVFFIKNKKYQFLKESGDNTIDSAYDHHCVYKNKRILNNRYKNYSNENHCFISF
jgi:hypothetical protein